MYPFRAHILSDAACFLAGFAKSPLCFPVERLWDWPSWISLYLGSEISPEDVDSLDIIFWPNLMIQIEDENIEGKVRYKSSQGRIQSGWGIRFLEETPERCASGPLVKLLRGPQPRYCRKACCQVPRQFS